MAEAVEPVELRWFHGLDGGQADSLRAFELGSQRESRGCHL